MKIPCSILKTLTSDSLELHGLLFEPKKETERVVLHIHGLAGNFYENRFIYSMARVYTEHGFSFLSVNTRGHDFIADILVEKGKEIEYERVGGAFELLEDCVKDIRAWVDLAFKELGFKHVVLQGHSSGAIKALYYCYTTRDERVEAMVLVSPSDDIGIQRRNLGNRFEDVLESAKKMVVNGEENALLSPDIFFGYPLSPKTYLNIFGKESFFRVMDLLNDESLEIAKKVWSSLNLPVLVVFGEHDEGLAAHPERYISILRTFLPSAIFKVIPGAHHSYIGHEEQLAKEIVEYLRSVFHEEGN